MATNITDYSDPLNFETVWIFHTPSKEDYTDSSGSTILGTKSPSDSDINATNNPEVPSVLQNISYEFGAANGVSVGSWTLVVGGVVIFSNRVYSATPIYQRLDGSSYDLGVEIEDVVYTKESLNTITTTSTAIGATLPGTLVGSGTNPTTAWVEGNNDGTYSNGSDTWDQLTDGVTWGIVYNGQIKAGLQTNLQYSGTDADGNPQFIDSDGNLYTRWREKYTINGATAYEVRKKAPDVTTTTSNQVTVKENTRYKFYQVLGQTQLETENMDANLVMVMPHHILQRHVAKRQGNYSFSALDLNSSHLRVVPNMDAARLEIRDLKINYGIEARAVPVRLQVGSDFVRIGINQITDVDALNAELNHVLQYDTDGVYRTKYLNTDTTVEGNNNLYFLDQRARDSFTNGTTSNKIHMDYDLLSDRSNSVAVSSLQSIAMFLDRNNSEDGNYFGLFNNEDETTTALSKESAVFRVEENGDIYSDGGLSLDGAFEVNGDITAGGIIYTKENGAVANRVATQIYVDTAISNLIDGAPAALDTLNELAASINDDAGVYQTLIDTIANLTVTTYGDTAPNDPQPGELWFDTATAGELLMWDGGSWIQLTGVVGTPASGGGGAVDLSAYVTTTAMNTAIQNFIEAGDITVQTGAASGGGSLSYNNGQFTFNPAVITDLTGYATETYVDDSIATLTGGVTIPSDINDLTDADGLLNTDINELSDVDGIIPTSLTDLGITDGTNGQVLSTNGSGTFSFIDAAAGGGGVTYIQSTQPSSGNQGELWWDNTNNILYVYNSNAWVIVDAELKTIPSYLDYPTSTIASGSGSFSFTINAGAPYTTTSRTAIVGYMSSTDTENIDFYVNASSTNKRFRFDLIRATTSGVFVEAGDSGVEGKMYKTSNMSTSVQTPVEGSVGSSGWPWGSTSIRWPVRILADAGITMSSNVSGRNWNFYDATLTTNVDASLFSAAFAEGVQG